MPIIKDYHLEHDFEDTNVPLGRPGKVIKSSALSPIDSVVSPSQFSNDIVYQDPVDDFSVDDDFSMDDQEDVATPPVVEALPSVQPTVDESKIRQELEQGLKSNVDDLLSALDGLKKRNFDDRTAKGMLDKAVEMDSYKQLQDLIDRPKSHIVNIASASGFTALPGGTTYASSKAAVSSFSESLRLELKKDGNTHVGITIVSPAYVNTGMFDGVKEPTFIPMLTTKKLATKVVKAVRKNKLFVLEPAFIKFIPLMKATFPRFLYDFLGNILGGYNSMDLWKGHSKYKSN